MNAPLSSDEFLQRIRSRLGDRYEISRELFGGGMSRVFVAREIALDRQVVIKFLPPEIAAEANRDRFRREIQMAAKLSHPHIAPLFAAAEEGELLYYTMPFIAGESLRHSLEGGRRFSVGEAMDILLDVADALAYAHRAGIVHRDIKPANVLREGGHAVITDFGVAKALSTALGPGSGPRSTTSQSTATGMSFGTPAYMAPEQIAGDTTADHRVDLYAFGLLGYELLTGKAPFNSTSPQAVLAAQLTQPPPPILDARPDVPPVLAALLTRCLEKEAGRRPPSAEAVLEVLRTVNAASGGAQYQAAPRSTSPSHRLAIGGGIAAVAAALWFGVGRGMFASAPPVVPPPPPAIDSTVLRAQQATAIAESVLRAVRSSDSARRANDRSAVRQDQRLLSLLRDSIANAMQRAQAESLARVKEAELALARREDSLTRAGRRTVFVPPLNVRTFVAPEAFTSRAANLGPPRHIGVALHSSLRDPAIVVAAGVMRDSISARLKGSGRYILVPNDSILQALSRSKDMDSLRTWLRADMWVTINVMAGRFGTDSVAWSIVMRDFTAHPQYRQSGVTTQPVAASGATFLSETRLLVDRVVRGLETLDRAPRESLKR